MSSSTRREIINAVSWKCCWLLPKYMLCRIFDMLCCSTLLPICLCPSMHPCYIHNDKGWHKCCSFVFILCVISLCHSLTCSPTVESHRSNKTDPLASTGVLGSWAFSVLNSVIKTFFAVLTLSWYTGWCADVIQFKHCQTSNWRDFPQCFYDCFLV